MKTPKIWENRPKIFSHPLQERISAGSQEFPLGFPKAKKHEEKNPSGEISKNMFSGVFLVISYKIHQIPVCV